MNPFGNLKLKWKLITIVFVPVVCLIYFAQNKVSDSRMVVNENQRILRLSQYAVNASALVHELQKERGFSAGFMSSQGSKFSTELGQQRQQVDKKISTLNAFMNDFTPELYGKNFAKQLQVALDRLSQIKSKRSAISDFKLPSKEAIAYYSQMHSVFLESIGFLAKNSSLGELSNMANAYTNFLNSKERAGIERAVLAAVFTQNIFKPGAYDHFKSLTTIQDTYMDVFKSLATADQLSFYNNTVKGEAIEATKTMHDLAVDHASTGNFGVDPAYWFKMQTRKIDLLKKVEDKLSHDLETLAHDLNKQANKTLTTSISLMTIALLLTFAFVFFVQRVITLPISRAVNIAHAIAQGDFSNTHRKFS